MRSDAHDHRWPGPCQGLRAQSLAKSDPITGDGPDVLAFDRLLGALDETQLRLADRLSTFPAEGFAEEIDVDGRTESLGRRAHFWYFHDTYHSGQTELLRQLTGVGDRVI